MHRDGYGFVIPNAGQRTTIEGDIFIPPTAIGPAMHGDQVLVELRPQEGQTAAPKARSCACSPAAIPTVVGTFHHGRATTTSRPSTRRSRRRSSFPRGMEWPAGEDAKEPSPAAAPEPARRRRARAGARRLEEAQRDRRPRYRRRGKRGGEWDDLEGVVVDVEITDWPAPTQNPRGRVVEILGYEDDFGVDVEIIIRKHHLPHRFPVEVLQEAQQFEPVDPGARTAPSPRLSQPAHRHHRWRDRARLRRCRDRAPHCRTATSSCRSISPTSRTTCAKARPSTWKRGCAALRSISLIAPIPMLPMELSTDLCSLRPQVDRLVLSCVMEIDHQGEIVGYTLNEGVIRSAERMTYTNVNLILEGDPALRAALSPPGGRLRADARAGDDPEPQARAARLHRLRSAGAGDRVRRERADEEHHALGAQHRQPHHRGVHAGGQRVRRQLPGEQGMSPRSTASTRSPIPSGSTTSRPSPRSSAIRWAWGRCRSSACRCKADRRERYGSGRQARSQSKFRKRCTSRRACIRS